MTSKLRQELLSPEVIVWGYGMLSLTLCNLLFEGPKEMRFSKRGGSTGEPRGKQEGCLLTIPLSSPWQCPLFSLWCAPFLLGAPRGPTTHTALDPPLLSFGAL